MNLERKTLHYNDKMTTSAQLLDIVSGGDYTVNINLDTLVKEDPLSLRVHMRHWAHTSPNSKFLLSGNLEFYQKMQIPKELESKVTYTGF
ncbi:MAG: hypothetical protein VX028_04400 [Nanoarchaeota archaeon]|nr:hypothetical protein [Nanoarchaeota archaeon]MEC8339370.1 hypothetical protein [Nanoarchaeota archaeon]